jgi:hypothetical protein
MQCSSCGTRPHLDAAVPQQLQVVVEAQYMPPMRHHNNDLRKQGGIGINAVASCLQLHTPWAAASVCDLPAGL